MKLTGILLLAVIYQLTFITTMASLPHVNCTRTYKKLGCFRARPNRLNELLINDRDPRSPHRVDWYNWEDYVHSLACRCADKTRKRGLTHFGLQNFGECWTGSDLEKNYDKEGLAKPKMCLMVAKNPPPPCDINDPRDCAGFPSVNYVYRLDKEECSKNPCKNGGTCVNTLAGFHCKCTKGFKGDLCDRDIDECASSPCKHGGSCKNTPGGFTCTCRQGFQGELCDQDVDECSKSPCKNGGTCVNTLGGFHCNCQQGFRGDLCDEDINECASSQPCKNGGTCINLVGSYECKCKTGYAGTHCGQVLDPCRSSPCQHGGSCVRKGSDFTCKCVTGFLGKHCEKDVNECKKSPCHNGSTCVNNMGSFQCLCPPGMQGKLCEQDVNECQQHVCLNGATCVNTIGGFRCKCKSGYSGKFCEKDVNECIFGFNPCKNGGTCANKQGSFQCLCPAGLTGMFCDLDVNECKQHLCLNGATCINTPGSFRCECKSGYSGKYCEKGTCSKPGQYDLGLIIDGSGSVGNHGFAQTKWFLLKLIPKFAVSKDKTHFGVILYSKEAEVICRFTDMTSYIPVYLKLRILAMEFPDGDTRTDKALKMAGVELYQPGRDRDQVPNVLVVITDGNTAQGSEPYKDVLKPLKDHGVNIIAVGVGNQVSVGELKEIALGRSDRVIQVATIEELDATKLSKMIHEIAVFNC